VVSFSFVSWSKLLQQVQSRLLT